MQCVCRVGTLGASAKGEAVVTSEGEALTFRDNPALDKSLDLYRSIEDDYVRSIEATGVTFAPYDEERTEARALKARLERAGARIRNGGASVSVGFLSRGCVACTGSCVSCTFAISNNCHRDCFFCFNPNEKDFAYYCEHQFPWRQNLDDLARKDSKPACLALSGGEPMLYPDEACAYFEYARELFPGVHTRLYTSGDLLNASLLDRLHDAGLDEVRFSVKQSDGREEQEKLFAIMELALERIPTVMVEMPPIPGTESSMRVLLKRLDNLGVHGINLLEFAYAMWNWEVFDSLGLTLRNPPNRVCYDYTYAGSLAVQGSEELCLRLMLWAIEERLTLGMHYCSLENKHRAQVRNINEPYANLDSRYAFDYGDYFMKTGMVFGPDRAPVRTALRALGCTDFLEDASADSTSFHPRWLPQAAKVHFADGSMVRPCVSTNVVTLHGGSPSLRELKVELLESAEPVQLEDTTKESDEAAGFGL